MSVGTRRPNDFLYEKIVIGPVGHPAVTATTAAQKFFKADRAFRVDKVEYLNVTGLAEDTTNVFTVAVNNGSTVVASHSTDSDLLVADASIPANTFMELTLSATDADRVLAAGDVLSIVLTEGGSASLPAGSVVIHGRYL